MQYLLLHGRSISVTPPLPPPPALHHHRRQSCHQGQCGEDHAEDHRPAAVHAAAAAAAAAAACGVDLDLGGQELGFPVLLI